MRAHLSILFILSLIAAPVRAQWQTNGNSLNGGGGPQLVTDGSGGAIVGWGNWDPWGGQWAYAMGQHLSAGGNELWEPYGQIVCNSTRQYSPQLVSDGAGGGIFVWLDNRNGHLDIYAQRLNAAGAEQWTSCGVPVRALPSDVGYNLAVVSDGSGGAIIAWSDPRASAGFDIYAQHVNLTGAMLWTANGVAVCTAAESQAPPVAVTDGSGGVWIAWDDARSGSNGDIYARHIAANGVPQGVANGLALCTAVDDQFRAAIAPDESGGVVVAWQDERTGTGDIYAQRVNSAGTSLWTTDGIAVCSQASHQESPDIASDGSGGAVVVWMDWRISPAGVSAYAQRVNSAGAIQWTAGRQLARVHRYSLGRRRGDHSRRRTIDRRVGRNGEQPEPRRRRADPASRCRRCCAVGSRWGSTTSLFRQWRWKRRRPRARVRRMGRRHRGVDRLVVLASLRGLCRAREPVGRRDRRRSCARPVDAGRRRVPAIRLPARRRLPSNCRRLPRWKSTSSTWPDGRCAQSSTTTRRFRK